MILMWNGRLGENLWKRIGVPILQVLWEEYLNSVTIGGSIKCDSEKCYWGKDSKRKNMGITRLNWMTDGESKSQQQTPAEKTSTKEFSLSIYNGHTIFWES